MTLFGLAAEIDGDAQEAISSQVSFLETVIAASIATLISISFTLWLRTIDQPRPNWALVLEKVRPTRKNYNFPEAPILELSISNYGAGPAQLVSVIGIWCLVETTDQVQTLSGNRVPIVMDGQNISINAIPSLEFWRRGGILVTWAQPRLFRNGHKRKYSFFPFSDYLDEVRGGRMITDQTGDLHEFQEIPFVPENYELLRMVDKRLEHGNMVKVGPSSRERRRIFRKLRKSGWHWQ
jgi:hypothetical protein